MTMRPRVIPALLLADGALVKTVRFADPAYVGDPSNAIRIFNDKEVDELALLDIQASRRGTPPDTTLIERLCGECFMPVAYGGGITSVAQMRDIFRCGVEKVILNTAAVESPTLVREASERFGSQAVVGAIDARRRPSADGWEAFLRNGTRGTGLEPAALAEQLCAAGVGEILLTAIDREGTMAGFDLDLMRSVTTRVGVPVIAHGGAGDVDDLRRAVTEGGASACAAGSMVVYFGRRRGVLINFPSPAELDRAFGTVATSHPVPSIQPAEAPAAVACASHAEDATGRRECVRCLYGTHNVPVISFDERGVCNYCQTLDQLEREYPRGDEGWRILERLAERIRREMRGKPYDIAVGVSGGCDSSYMLVLAKQLGLRPLAVHFDNTWNSKIAVENIQCMLRKLDIDLYTYVVDNDEYDDIYRAMLASGTPDVESPTDLGLASVLNMACEKHGIRYIFEGHSYRTEGICPLGWLYMDGRYIAQVHRRFGRQPMRTFPNMPLHRFLWWTIGRRLMKIRPLYHLDYRKEETKAMLARDFGWQWYGGHHLENRFTAFFHTYFWPRRWGIDGRLLGHCALVWSGQMERATALAEIERPPAYDPALIEHVRQRLGYTPAEWEGVMTLPKRTYLDYPSYKRIFEWLRPVFWALYRAQRVPKSFYLKYCHPYKGKPFTGHQPVWGQPVPKIEPPC